MIVLRLYGGLGNQLFQLGSALLVAKKRNISKIVVDLSQISHYSTSHNFVLDGILDCSFAQEALNITIEFKTLFITRLRLPKLFNFNSTLNPFLTDKNFRYGLKNGNFLNLFVLDGYFQECLLQSDFNEILSLLSKLLKSPPEKDIERFKSFDALVHVRGGDFISLDRNPRLGSTFYLESIKRFSLEKLITRVLVVTDDKDYAKCMLNLDYKNIDFIFSEGNEIHDFLAIATIPNRILAPSTFGLMAAALGDNPSGSLVLAWKNWYGEVKRIISVPNEDNNESTTGKSK
tara:strand:+ start:1470 stop:2336 length:867 start_codon:yes stop_codon:yes gene_type:complete